VVSLGIGAFTADLPFWRRALQLPLPPGGVYLPTAIIGADQAKSPAPLVPSPQAEGAFDPLLVEEAANRARAAGSRALLVMHRGRLAIERYFVADDADSLLPATLIARPMVAMAAGIAAQGRSGWLDAPLSSVLREWSDDARGRITLRQLLQRSPWSDFTGLPRFATARGVRMLLGNDYESTALGFRLDHEPGGFRNYSPANAQLAAVVIERTTGQPYEEFVDQRLWQVVGAGHAELQLDRRAGMPAAHCCWLATARDMLRVAALLGTDGRLGEQQVLPAGWVAEMSRPSRVSAETGMQVRRLKLEGEDAIAATDGEGSGFWVLAARELVVLDVAGNGDVPPDEIAALLVRALAAPN
jgi:CubicO group peptidase (beta-lactamase class C family)